MKTVFTTTLAIWLLSMTSIAAEPATQKLNGLMPVYLSIKEALVNSEATTAAGKAAEFEKVLATIKADDLSTAERKQFTGLKSKLIKDAGQIAKSKDLEKQRASFETLSANLLLLAKSVKLSDQPVYTQYCPMKKASWLSTEKTIRNPYYGKQMLECGQIKETI
jgi:hypothetical protein